MSVVTTKIKAIAQQLTVLLFNLLCIEEMEVLTKQYENQSYDNAYESIWEISKMANFHFWITISLNTTVFFFLQKPRSLKEVQVLGMYASYYE